MVQVHLNSTRRRGAAPKLRNIVDTIQHCALMDLRIIRGIRRQTRVNPILIR